jgi:LmbE family N-acetylglucosaminyl deacetylase
MSAAPAEAFIAALQARRSIAEKVMIVAGHPDDETIGVGAQLCRFEDLLIVHATDGAPRDMNDAARYGFARREDYAAARRNELANALAAGGAAHARAIALDIPDQEACRDLADLARRVRELIASEAPHVIVTHAYEGGHPDHDACAFAVHAACRLSPRQSAPAIIEMALYHRWDGECAKGQFLEPSSRRKPGSTDPLSERSKDGSPPSPGRRSQSDTVVLALDPDDVSRKQRMIDAFATQRWLLTSFPLDCERLRVAPEYDFRQPPHPGVLHYETLGWKITGAGWRDHAAAALGQLGLADLPCF